MAGGWNEMVVFVARHTGWSLEYIRGMELGQLRSFSDELHYQVAQEAYNAAYPVALLITTRLKDATVEDILGPRPGRADETESKEADIWKLAKKAGIKLPSRLS
jgi:hypothetical protein